MPDYETVQRNRNITVGLFVLIALTALVFLIYRFEGMPATIREHKSFQIFVQFPTAQGVQTNTPVRFCGYEIGRVIEVKTPELLEDLKTNEVYHQTLVVMGIDRKYVNIPSNIEVKVMTRGLGSSYIDMKVDPKKPLKPRDPNCPETVYLIDKMLLQGSAGMTSEFFPAESQEKLDQLVTSLISLMNNANDIIGKKTNKDNIEATLANLSEASQHATDALEEFHKLCASGINTSEELGKTITELRTVMNKINNEESTAGRFINDGRLYENLLESSQQLKLLIEDLKSFVAEARENGIKVKL